jgi:hypothetical protein
LYRTSARQQKQGMENHNTFIRPVGNDGGSRRISSYSETCRGLRDQHTLQWTTQYADLMTKARAFRSLRLSKDLAFYASDEVLAEYRGRFLGKVHDNVVVVSDTLDHRPWIRNAVAQIGCELK